MSFCNNLWSKPEYRRKIWNAVGAIPACSSFVTFVAHAKNTKATVTLNFCVLEGPVAQLDQLKVLLNGYITK
jgi:hypothetical protein